MALYSYPSLSISNCVTVKLTDRNYIIWKSQFESFLSSQMLLCFVNGAAKRPSQTIPVKNSACLTEEVKNPDFQAWFRSDPVVRAWLLCCCNSYGRFGNSRGRGFFSTSRREFYQQISSSTKPFHCFR